MTWNVKAPLNTSESRPAVVEAVLAELTQISFRDWIGALRRWHEGSLSLVHMNVLMLLHSQGPMAMSQLADLLDVSVASTTGIIDRMEKRGIVERRRSDVDRRVVEVHVTEKAEEIFMAMEAERRVRLSRLVETISDAELSALLTGLRAFRSARERLGMPR